MPTETPGAPSPAPPRRAGFHHMAGTIWSAGFASGDRLVVGRWARSPIGPMTDVMWARPDDERVLLVADPAAAAFVSAIYRFDRVGVVTLDARLDGRALDVAAGDLCLSLVAGPGWRLPLGHRRWPWVTRWLEGPVARPLLGVRTYGVSPLGVRQWYRADEYRPLVRALGRVAGTDLGAMRGLDPPVRFGFSEPPRRPSMVRVRPLLHDPTGRLDGVLAGLAGDGGGRR